MKPRSSRTSGAAFTDAPGSRLIPTSKLENERFVSSYEQIANLAPFTFYAATTKLVEWENYEARLDTFARYGDELIRVCCSGYSAFADSANILFADEAGNFYGLEKEDGDAGTKRKFSRLGTGKEAARWFIRTGNLCDYLKHGILRAIDAPEFEFMPLVAIGAKRPRKRTAKKPAPVFAVQLEMATALVSAARSLAAAPDAEKLAAARRAVSALHQTLHAEATFKAASAA